MLRDPRYLLPLAILVGVIAVAALLADGDARAASNLTQPAMPATPVDAGSRSGVGPAGIALRHDLRRSQDLEELRSGVAVYHVHHGAYPNTDNAVTPMCEAPSDAGCEVAAVAAVRFDDGDLPYWYASDGESYFL